MIDAKFSISNNEYLPLRDVVFNTLRDAILTGQLVPGERLMENQLADKLGVSRTPIREALRMLELEHLVELVPRKGAQVLDMSRRDVEDILEIRGALEGLATRIACEKMTPGEVVKLRQLEADLEKAYDAQDRDSVIVLDEEFHDLIFASTENEKLIQIYNNLRTQLYRYRRAHVKLGVTLDPIIDSHRNILRAIEKDDPAAGAAAAEGHISYHIEVILDSIKNKK